MADFFHTCTTFTYSLVEVLNSLWDLLTTPLKNVSSLLPGSTPDFIADLLDLILDLFGNITLANLMFGGMLLLFVLYSLFKWLK